MTNNCLFTKYLASVDNDALITLDEMEIGVGINVNPTNKANLRKIQITGLNTPTDFRIVGDGYFTDSTFTQNLTKSIHKDSGDFTLYVSDFEGKIVTNLKKHNYIGITLGSELYMDISLIGQNLRTSMATVDIHGNINTYGDVVKISPKFVDRNPQYPSSIDLFNTSVSGNIEDFAFGTIRVFNVQNCSGVYGSISNVTTAFKMENFNLRGTNCTGEIKTLIENIAATGVSGRRTSGTMNIRCNSNITFNSVAGYDSDTPVVCVFTADGVTVSYNGVTLGTYNGSTWSYS